MLCRILCRKLKQFCSLKNFVIVICTLLTCFLTFTVVFKFSITRPTSSSQEHATFNFETFPDVVICVDPAINQTISQEYGYDTPWAYYVGRNGTWEGDFIGWNGAKAKNNPTEIFENIFNVKSSNGGLVSRVRMGNGDGEYRTQPMNFFYDP